MSIYPPVKVGLLGLGTVGGGVTRVLARNAEEISRRAGREIVITHAAARNLDTTTANTGRDETDRRGAGGGGRSRSVDHRRIDGRLRTGAQSGIAGAGQRQACGHRQQGADRPARQRNFRRRRAAGMMVGFEAAVAGGIPDHQGHPRRAGRQSVWNGWRASSTAPPISS
jgi:homoserine dehydrogenase